MKSRVLVLVTVTILLISWFLAVIIPVSRGYFNFTYDFSRDLIWAKNQIDFQVPALVGPWGSLNGLFFGPLWYWLLIVPLLVGGNSPIVAVFFDTAFILFGIVVGSLLIYRENHRLAAFFLILSLASPAMRAISGYAFAQNMLPFFTFILIYSYAKLLDRFTLRFLMLAGFSLSLLYHAEPPTAVVSFASLAPIIFLSKEKNRFFSTKAMLAFFSVYLLPFVTIFIFDLRHQFLQAKAVLSYLQGQNESLQGALSLGERLTDRFSKTGGVIVGAIFSNLQVAGLFVGLLAFSSRFKGEGVPVNKFARNLLIASLSYIATIIIGFLIFKPELKSFYLNGLFPIGIIFLSVFCVNIWTEQKQKLVVVITLLLVYWFSFNPPNLLKAYENDFKEMRSSNGVYANQIETVNWIYRTASGSGFKVYAYSAAIYDFPYQYIFMTHGVKTFGYLPAEFSYLPDRPNYVEKKPEQLIINQSKIKTPAKFLYLIIDPDNSRESEKKNWLRHFSESEEFTLNTKELIDGTKIEMRLSIE